MRKINRIGRRYGKLVVIAEAEGKGRGSWWQCQCDCGEYTTVRGANLNSGNTKSCGCLKDTAIDMANKVFGGLTVIGGVNADFVGIDGIIKLPHETPAAQWLCRCECGVLCWVRGHNLRSGSTQSCGKCRPKNGANAPGWRGGRRKSKQGYIRVHAPTHPNADSQGYVMEHRLVMSQKLGRALFPYENVHHVNGRKDDNRPENLELWTTLQPSGQRVEDLIAFARSILAKYSERS